MQIRTEKALLWSMISMQSFIHARQKLRLFTNQKEYDKELCSLKNIESKLPK